MDKILIEKLNEHFSLINKRKTHIDKMLSNYKLSKYDSHDLINDSLHALFIKKLVEINFKFDKQRLGNDTRLKIEVKNEKGYLYYCDYRCKTWCELDFLSEYYSNIDIVDNHINLFNLINKDFIKVIVEITELLKKYDEIVDMAWSEKIELNIELHHVSSDNLSTKKVDNIQLKKRNRNDEG